MKHCEADSFSTNPQIQIAGLDCFPWRKIRRGTRTTRADTAKEMLQM